MTQNFAPMSSEFCTHVLGILHPCQKQRPRLVFGSTPILKREVLFLSLTLKSDHINSGSAGHQKNAPREPSKKRGESPPKNRGSQKKAKAKAKAKTFVEWKSKDGKEEKKGKRKRGRIRIPDFPGWERAEMGRMGQWGRNGPEARDRPPAFLPRRREAGFCFKGQPGGKGGGAILPRRN